MEQAVKKKLAFIIQMVFIAVIVVLVYLVTKYLIGWILPFLVAFGIVSLVNPVICVIKKNLKIKQEIVSLLVILLIYALVGVLLFLIIMQLVLLIRDGLTILPSYYTNTVQPALVKASNAIVAFFQDLPEEWQGQISAISDDVLNALQSFLFELSSKGIRAVSNITSRIPSFLIAFMFTIMLSFFIGMQYDKVVDFIRVQLPAPVKRIIVDLRSIVVDTVIKYFRAAITLMFITAITLSIGLLAIRTQNAIPIALGIAVFDALPFFGTGAIMIPWCLVELLQGNYKYAFGLLIVYAIITFLRNIIEPKVVGDKLGLNPIVSLSSIYLGLKVFGVLGMIFMPIVTQIVMELHHKGTIRLFKERKLNAPKQSGKESVE